MKAEEYFKDQWPYLFEWINVDKRSMEYVITSAFRAGEKLSEETWERRMKDRQFLEDELQALDLEDDLRQEAQLREGLG